MKSKKTKIQVGDLVRSCYGKAMGYTESKQSHNKRHDKERQLGIIVSLEGVRGGKKPEHSWNVEWLNGTLSGMEEVFLERFLEKIE